jgi:uncharacterized RmlC-like cupin family protein
VEFQGILDRLVEIEIIAADRPSSGGPGPSSPPSAYGGTLELWRRMTGGPMEEHLQPRVVQAQQRVRQAALQTAGVLREQAFSTDDVWIGIVTTEPGAMSAWHHHGDHDTYAYVVSGLKRIEYGPGGTASLVARPDDFIHLPKGLMHRGGNPSEEGSYSIAFRLGRGPATINVEGPP